MICAALVNTQTHTERQLLAIYILLAQPAQLMIADNAAMQDISAIC